MMHASNDNLHAPAIMSELNVGAQEQLNGSSNTGGTKE